MLDRTEKRIIITTKVAIFVLTVNVAATLAAMPTQEELSKAGSLIQELMRDDLAAVRNGKKTREQVGDTAVALAREAQSPAEKYLLLTAAFDHYMRGGSYDKANSSLIALRTAIPDWKHSDEYALIEKSLRIIASGKGGLVRERYAALKERQQYALKLKKALEQAAAKPGDKKLQLQVAAYYAALDRWPQALDAFLAGSSPACAAAAKLEKESAEPGQVADAWWSASDINPEFLSVAIRAHAADLYKKAIAANSLAGLQKVAAEKRIKEASAADQSATPAAADDKKSAKSYVQYGLVAQWDGIENAGYGRHQAQRSEWVDWKGGKSFSLTKAASFSDNALVCDGTGYAGIMKGSIPSSKIVTAEIVFEIVATHGNSCLFSTGEHKSFYERCFGVVSGGAVLVFADHAIGKVANGRHSCHLNFSSGEFYVDGVKGVSAGKGTLDAMPARGEGFYIGGFRNSAIVCNIHSIRFYDRKLTDEEVKRNYQIDKERFCL